MCIHGGKHQHQHQQQQQQQHQQQRHHDVARNDGFEEMGHSPNGGLINQGD